MENARYISLFVQIIGFLMIVLYLIFGLKLNAAGNQLDNKSLRQAGTLIIIIVFLIITVVCCAIYLIESNQLDIL